MADAQKPRGGATVTVVAPVMVRFSGNAPTIQTFERLPDDNPIYSLVGHVASDWAYLEHTLDLIIWELTNIKQPIGACLTAQMMGHSPRCEAIIALMTHLGFSEKTVKKMELFKQRLYDIAAPRNRVVHDPWLLIKTDSPEGLSHDPGQYKSMARKELKFGATETSIDEIQALITKISAKQKECLDLRHEISIELKSLPGQAP